MLPKRDLTSAILSIPLIVGDEFDKRIEGGKVGMYDTPVPVFDALQQDSPWNWSPSKTDKRWRYLHSYFPVVPEGLLWLENSLCCREGREHYVCDIARRDPLIDGHQIERINGLESALCNFRIPAAHVGYLQGGWLLLQLRNKYIHRGFRPLSHLWLEPLMILSCWKQRR